jgi:UDP-3-O-acyl-N-acetylglucosamine deacetylase
MDARPGRFPRRLADNATCSTIRVLNNDGLRYDDEFVVHGALDAIGDLKCWAIW